MVWTVVLALIVLFVVRAVKRAWDDLPGGYVWHVRWPLLTLGWPAVLVRISKLPPVLQRHSATARSFLRPG
jgi:hypothetical protein